MKFSNEELKKFHSKRFCVFDDSAFPAYDLPEADPMLKKYLSYNPVHNKRTFEEKGIEKDDEYFYQENRELIETDRTGFRYYDRIYSLYFPKIKEEKMNVLEVGVEYGYGVLAWSRYFKNARVCGMEKLASYHFQSDYDHIKNNFSENWKRININTSRDSTDKNNWKELYQDVKFDIIIDDGCHRLENQIKTLENSLEYLSEKCYYFIEDIKLEYFKEEIIEKFIKTLRKIAKENNLKMNLYSHVNPYLINLQQMTKEERIEHSFQKNLKEGYDAASSLEIAKKAVSLYNNNHNNYMIAFTR